MSWNLRVLVTEEKMIGGADELCFALHEVYYNSKKIPNTSTKNPVKVLYDSVEGLKWYIEQMNIALTKPALWGEKRFPEEYKINNYENE